MATGLYEALDIERNASPEQIRKAYRKKALQTHPDRLPRDIPLAEKEAAEERFRQINNAYEVLIDDQKRREYDQHGVWPVPEEPQSQRHSGPSHYGFPDPFFGDPFFPNSFQSRFRPRSAFADPFDIFNSFFNETPFDRAYPGTRHNPWGSNQGHMAFGSGYSVIFGQDFGGAPSRDSQGGLNAYSSTSLHTNHSPYWVSESRIARSINGVTESIHERRDSAGNTHVTVKRPDGRETYTINGVEQAPRPGGSIESAHGSDHARHLHSRSHRSNLRHQGK